MIRLIHNNLGKLSVIDFNIGSNEVPNWFPVPFNSITKIVTWDADNPAHRIIKPLWDAYVLANGMSDLSDIPPQAIAPTLDIAGFNVAFVSNPELARIVSNLPAWVAISWNNAASSQDLTTAIELWNLVIEQVNPTQAEINKIRELQIEYNLNRKVAINNSGIISFL